MKTFLTSNNNFCSSFLGTNPLDMEAVLTFPNGKSELCAIKDLDDSLYDIHFKPEMEGVHTVSLKHKGLHISGNYVHSY